MYMTPTYTHVLTHTGQLNPRFQYSEAEYLQKCDLIATAVNQWNQAAYVREFFAEPPRAYRFFCVHFLFFFFFLGFANALQSLAARTGFASNIFCTKHSIEKSFYLVPSTRAQVLLENIL
jgi:hypothetical protein